LISLVPILIFFLVIGFFLQQTYQNYRVQQLSTASQLFNHQLQQSHLRSLDLLDLLARVNESMGEDLCQCIIAQLSDIEPWNQLTGRGFLDFPSHVRWAVGSPGKGLYGIYPLRALEENELYLIQSLDLTFWDQISLTLPVNLIVYYPLTSQVIWSNLLEEQAQATLLELRTPNQPSTGLLRSQQSLYLSNALIPTIGDPIQVVFFSSSTQIELLVLRITRVAFILVLGVLIGVLAQMKLIDKLIFHHIRAITNLLPSLETYLGSKSSIFKELAPLAGFNDVAHLNQEFLAMVARFEERFHDQQETLESLEKKHFAREKSQQAFFGFLGQEIRSPLHSMKGLSNLLLSNNPAKESKEVIEILNKEIERVSEIIALLFDLHVYTASGGVQVNEGFTVSELIGQLKEAIPESGEPIVQVTSSIHPRLPLWGPRRIIYTILIRLVKKLLIDQSIEDLIVDSSLDSLNEPKPKLFRSYDQTDNQINQGSIPIQFSIQVVFTEGSNLDHLNSEFLFIRYLLLPLEGVVTVQHSSFGLDQKKQITLVIQLPLALDEREKNSTKPGHNSVSMPNQSNTMDLNQPNQSTNGLEPMVEPSLPIMYGRTSNDTLVKVPKQLYADLLSQDPRILSQALLILRVLSSEREHVKLEQLVLLADAHLQAYGLNEECIRLRSLLIDYLQPQTELS
jgi:signal transduction histidine kinase